MAKNNSPMTKLEMTNSLVKAVAPELKGNKSFIDLTNVDLAPLEKVDANEKPDISKSVLRLLNGPMDSVERLAFEVNPSITNNTAGIYKPKQKLLPDAVLKRIAIQDDLVASIVNARGHHISSFGRPRPDRFANGYVLEPRPGIVEKLTPEQKKQLDLRMEQVIDLFHKCGHTDGLKKKDYCSFSEYLNISAKNAVTVGRIATEIVWGVDTTTGGKKFHRFRAADAGTIYHAANYQDAAASYRKKAIKLLENLKNKKIKEEKIPGEDEEQVSWVQVIEGTPMQVFTDDQLACHNFYPVVDVEMDGYPVTPIDTMISAVTTHISITTQSKLYFQSGRASRGMLIIKSDDVDEGAIARIKQQFNASINNVNNSYRMPVFAIGQGDDIGWSSIDSTTRDAEFQYLTDQNARVILSAFQMSPEELPGWSYLSRGTNSQSLAESNNNYLLTAARDVGLRPLIAQFEDFINNSIFPLIDPTLAKICRLKLVGLDAETPEKEAVRLQQDMPVHMTYDQVLEKVEKKPVGKAMGGEFPLNPQFQSILDKYLTVGQIVEVFFGIQGAAANPDLAYIRDPFWFNFQNLKQQIQQQQQAQQQQAQQAQQQAGGNPGQAAGGGEGVSDDADPEGGGSKKPYPEPTEKQKTEESGQDLTRSIDQAMAVLSKGEAQLPPSRKRLLEHHQKTISHAISAWEDEMKRTVETITGVAKKSMKRSK